MLLQLAHLSFKRGNFWLSLMYTLGGTITVLCISRSGNFRWEWFDTLVAALVVLCIIIWAIVGPWYATIVSSRALLIAGLPQLKESVEEPWETPVPVYIGYTVANILSILGGKEWTVEERCYPVCAGIYCLAISILALVMRRFRDKAQIPLLELAKTPI